MKNHIHHLKNIMMLSTALLLTACGGGSDSNTNQESEKTDRSNRYTSSLVMTQNGSETRFASREVGDVMEATDYAYAVVSNQKYMNVRQLVFRPQNNDKKNIAISYNMSTKAVQEISVYQENDAPYQCNDCKGIIINYDAQTGASEILFSGTALQQTNSENTMTLTGSLQGEVISLPQNMATTEPNYGSISVGEQNATVIESEYTKKPNRDDVFLLLDNGLSISLTRNIPRANGVTINLTSSEVIKYTQIVVNQNLNVYGSNRLPVNNIKIKQDAGGNWAEVEFIDLVLTKAALFGAEPDTSAQETITLNGKARLLTKQASLSLGDDSVLSGSFSDTRAVFNNSRLDSVGKVDIATSTGSSIIRYSYRGVRVYSDLDTQQVYAIELNTPDNKLYRCGGSTGLDCAGASVDYATNAISLVNVRMRSEDGLMTTALSGQVIYSFKEPVADAKVDTEVVVESTMGVSDSDTPNSGNTGTSTPPVNNCLGNLTFC